MPNGGSLRLVGGNFHLCLAPKSRMSGTIPPLPQYTFIACTGMTSRFMLICYLFNP
jgi:hypothetical protein